MSPQQYAEYASACYSMAPTIGSANSSARAIIFPDGIVGFPGTDNIACWLADLDAFVTDVPSLGSVHSGFWEAFEEIEGQLLTQRGVRITLGHSEGAALALLYAARLCLAGRPPEAVYAFEPPRVSADGTLAQLFRTNGVRLMLTQKGEDVVPMIPRTLQSWQHPGPLTYIGTPAYPFPNLEDHLIDGVIKALADVVN